MNPAMSYSKTGLDLTESMEGVRLEAYQDGGGVWTIGYGHTKGVYAGMTITDAEAIAFLKEDTQDAVNNVNREVQVTLTQGEFDALVDFDFNCGDGNLDSSTLLHLVNQDDLTEAANEFEKWDHLGGLVVSGLLRRRTADRKEFVES